MARLLKDWSDGQSAYSHPSNQLTGLSGADVDTTLHSKDMETRHSSHGQGTIDSEAQTAEPRIPSEDTRLVYLTFRQIGKRDTEDSVGQTW
jgi:hypothetical protein